MTPQQIDQIIAALNRLAPPAQKLGFGDLPLPTIVYVKNEGDYLWYTWDHANNKPLAIHAPALTGYLRGIERIEKEFRGDAKPKLRIHIEADQGYIIQTGLDSVFARGFLLNLLALDPAQLALPITIAPEGNDAKENGGLSTVFCRLYVGEQRVMSEWDSKADPEKLFKQGQARLGKDSPAEEAPRTGSAKPGPSSGNTTTTPPKKQAKTHTPTQHSKWLYGTLTGEFGLDEDDVLPVVRILADDPGLEDLHAIEREVVKTIKRNIEAKPSLVKEAYGKLEFA